jgi:ethanolamine utilization protein EutA (predicted chaperonin)
MKGEKSMTPNMTPMIKYNKLQEAAAKNFNLKVYRTAHIKLESIVNEIVETVCRVARKQNSEALSDEHFEDIIKAIFGDDE